MLANSNKRIFALMANKLVWTSERDVISYSRLGAIELPKAGILSAEGVEQHSLDGECSLLDAPSSQSVC